MLPWIEFNFLKKKRDRDSESSQEQLGRPLPLSGYSLFTLRDGSSQAKPKYINVSPQPGIFIIASDEDLQIYGTWKERDKAFEGETEPQEIRQRKRDWQRKRVIKRMKRDGNKKKLLIGK